jgi:hypothetical protein
MQAAVSFRRCMGDARNRISERHLEKKIIIVTLRYAYFDTVVIVVGVLLLYKENVVALYAAVVTLLG